MNSLYKIVVIGTISSLLISAVTACNGSSSSAKKWQVEAIIAKIEKFHTENGRLPDSLTEVGVQETESGPIYYERKSVSRYIVWFGKELGESVTYDSATKRWDR